ncbi:MAG TPA: DUF4870 domain-containing protein [Rubrobacteraceae bacterium]|nr:DUF4870 domain-containing protein [Rubrobacteraceae bacterium]
MQEEHDPGVRRETTHAGAGAPQGTSGTMSAQDEKTWSIIAHLSVLAALVGLMPLGALIVWLIYKDRSPRVGFHALQALWYQIAWLVILVVYFVVSLVLSLVIIGIFMFFLLPLIALVPLIHGCYAAYQVSQGVDYRYPYIADRIDGGGARRAL